MHPSWSNINPNYVYGQPPPLQGMDECMPPTPSSSDLNTPSPDAAHFVNHMAYGNVWYPIPPVVGMPPPTVPKFLTMPGIKYGKLGRMRISTYNKAIADTTNLLEEIRRFHSWSRLTDELPMDWREQDVCAKKIVIELQDNVKKLGNRRGRLAALVKIHECISGAETNRFIYNMKMYLFFFPGELPKFRQFKKTFDL
ncbi:unnamed protein product [Caenorhabditis sp. 36 PRJEB53466]|nr:unnamed protein product [Caenorhabditis sp. 36 PRJEB53466]